MNKDRSFRWIKVPVTNNSKESKDAAETVLYLLAYFKGWYGMKDSQDFVGVIYDVQDNLNELVSPELQQWAIDQVKNEHDERHSLWDEIDEWKDKYREEKEKNQKLREKNAELRVNIPAKKSPAEKPKVKKLKFNTKRKDELNNN